MQGEQNRQFSQRTPFGRLPFYYGWVILAAGALGIVASIPGQTMGVSVFTDHLIAALQVSRVGISTAYMVGTLLSALLIPYAGKLFDRIGARLTAAISAFALGLFLLFLAFSGRLSSVLISTGIPVFPVGIALAVMGFFGIRFFGQGVLTLASRGMVVRWFSSRRGLATGFLGVATAFGFSYAPRPLQALIDRFGWSGALIALGAFLIVVFVPFIILFFRNDPAVIGIGIEEGLSLRQQRVHAGHEAEVDLRAAEARCDIRYWILILALGFWALFNTGFTFHIISIFAEVGTGTQEALKIFLPISVISVASRFIASWLSDRIDLKYIVYLLTLFMVISGMALQLLGNNPFIRYLIIMGLGITGGLFGVLNMVSWPKLFGLRYVGEVSGYAMAFVVAGSAIGPWLFSLSFRLTGGYRAAGLFSAVFCLLLLILAAATRFTSAIGPQHAEN